MVGQLKDPAVRRGWVDYGDATGGSGAGHRVMCGSPLTLRVVHHQVDEGRVLVPRLNLFLRSIEPPETPVDPQAKVLGKGFPDETLLGLQGRKRVQRANSRGAHTIASVTRSIWRTKDPMEALPCGYRPKAWLLLPLWVRARIPRRTHAGREAVTGYPTTPTGPNRPPIMAPARATGPKTNAHTIARSGERRWTKRTARVNGTAAGQPRANNNKNWFKSGPEMPNWKPNLTTEIPTTRRGSQRE